MSFLQRINRSLFTPKTIRSTKTSKRPIHKLYYLRWVEIIIQTNLAAWKKLTWAHVLDCDANSFLRPFLGLQESKLTNPAEVALKSSLTMWTQPSEELPSSSICATLICLLHRINGNPKLWHFVISPTPHPCTQTCMVDALLTELGARHDFDDLNSNKDAGRHGLPPEVC